MSDDEDIAEFRRRYREVSYDTRLRASGAPLRMRRGFYELEKDRPGQQQILESCSAYAAWFPGNWRTGTGMTLVGAAGIGKTQLACSVIYQLSVSERYICAFARFAEYVRNQQQLIRYGAVMRGDDSYAQLAREQAEQIEQWDWVLRRGAYLLVLDDVGHEYRTASGYSAQLLESLLRVRYDLGLPTIITSNLPLSAWSEEYSESLRSFVLEACPVVSG